MNALEIATLSISLLAAVAAAWAALVARKTLHTQRHMQSWSVSYQILLAANNILATDPSLIELHGISPEELAKHGVTAKEVAYVNLHLDSGSALARISGEQKIELTEYRKKFLRNARVRMIWNIFLRNRLFFENTPFSRAVNAYISEIDSNE